MAPYRERGRNLDGGTHPRRKIIRWLLMITLLAGSLWAIESNGGFLRLVRVRVHPPGAIPEEVVWSVLTCAERRIWPLALFNASSVADRLEAKFPIVARVGYGGFGKLKVQVTPRRPVARLMWRGTLWFWSSDGFLWSASLPQNSAVAGMTYPAGPIIFWDRTMEPLIDGASLNRDVIHCGAPVDRVVSLLEEVSALRPPGMELRGIKVSYNGDPAMLGTAIYASGDVEALKVVFNATDPKGVRRAISAVAELQRKGVISGDSVLVDCTYGDKIILRKEPSGN
jgi:hypothetical protein